jgi:pyruvate-formate lyase-activating enzyme
MTVCDSTSKVRHASRHKALHHLRGLRTRKGYEGAVYRCRYCDGWHVGNLVRDRRRQRVANREG